jgi:hypothetical protein
VEVLTRMEYEWYKEDDAHTAPLYAARAVLPYLLVANVRAANVSYRAFTSALVAENKTLGVQNVSIRNLDVKVFPSLPLLNFLGLLLLAIQKASPDVFRQLRTEYAGHLADAGSWNEALEMIGEMYFGLQRPRQNNPLFDLMGNMFGGAGGGFPAGAGRNPAARRVDAPAAEGLD